MLQSQTSTHTTSSSAPSATSFRRCRTRATSRSQGPGMRGFLNWVRPDGPTCTLADTSSDLSVGSWLTHTQSHRSLTAATAVSSCANKTRQMASAQAAGSPCCVRDACSTHTQSSRRPPPALGTAAMTAPAGKQGRAAVREGWRAVPGHTCVQTLGVLLVTDGCCCCCSSTAPALLQRC